MLIRLRIKDYILIDELEIDFSRGFNVLTGETGAGKSILLGALRLALGERATGSVTRADGQERKAVVQALFSLADPDRLAIAELIEGFEGDELLLSREILPSGKTTCKINGELCTVAELKQVGSLLMAIHGQNDHQALAHSDVQLALLDHYLSPSEQAVYLRVKECYKTLKQTQRSLEDTATDPSAIERELDLVRFQMDDIDQAELLEEEDSLEERLETMRHAEALIGDMETINSLLDGEDLDGMTVTRGLSEVLRKTDSLIKYLPNVKSYREWLVDVLYQLKDFMAENERSISALQFDPYALQQLEKRVDTINHLKRKYGSNIREIVTFRATLDLKLEQLENLSTQKERLNEQIRSLEKHYNNLCNELSSFRKKHASILEKHLQIALADLNFKEATVGIELSQRGAPHPMGNDHMELLVSLNKGMPLAPLKKVASGGEISRVMLAIKSIAAQADGLGTLIFDEIDAGISGHTASVVADKLYQVSQYHQVICISHLAQVALMADAHFSIEKSVEDERTVSQVRLLNQNGRIEEIARIMGGNNTSAAIFDNAKELIQTTQLRKKTFHP